MNELIIVCGIPGSGKSTYINEHYDKNKYNIISRDKIRFSKLKEGENYFAHENEVWREFIDSARLLLKEGKNVVMDATHLNRSARAKVLNALNGYITEDTVVTALAIEVDVDTAIERNEQREGLAYVHPDIIESMYRSYSTPSATEDFNVIKIVKNDTKFKDNPMKEFITKREV